MDIRNIAIIAHVDHGKTTLVNALLEAGGVFKAYRAVSSCVMDSDDLEKERGITIYSKNAAIEYKGTKINIVDTPGHADFGSEVERVLRTVDATLLLVDAVEGPMPQTKFVLKKSLDLGLPVLVVINKIDKPAARPDKVIDMTFDLFAKLGASDEQLDFPYIYAIAREGVAICDLNDPKKNIFPLLDFILKYVPVANSNQEADFKMQPATLSYDSYLGRLAIGRVYQGIAKVGQTVTVLKPNGEKRTGKISKLFTFQGLQRIEVKEVIAGDIVALAGIADIYVGETIALGENAKALPAINVDAPSLAMYFMVNDSPFAGKEGKFLTSRHIKDRLEKELETNVGLKMEMTDSADCFKIYGRGEMHLSVLIENMRREWFELQVSQPEVVIQEIDGKKYEPVENVIVNLPDAMAGTIIEALGKRKGVMKNMNAHKGNTILEFDVPTRGLLGFRSAFIILTKGEGTLYHSFDHLAPHFGKIEKRQMGSMISMATGEAIAFSLWNLQERGPLFVSPQDKIYEGMVIWEYNQGWDLMVNPLKGKKLTNMRSSGADDAINLTPPLDMNLEKALEYIQEDELVEVTPLNIRIRKKYLTENERKKNTPKRKK